MVLYVLDVDFVDIESEESEGHQKLFTHQSANPEITTEMANGATKVSNSLLPLNNQSDLPKPGEEQRI